MTFGEIARYALFASEGDWADPVLWAAELETDGGERVWVSPGNVPSPDFAGAALMTRSVAHDRAFRLAAATGYAGVRIFRIRWWHLLKRKLSGRAV